MTDATRASLKFKLFPPMATKRTNVSIVQLGTIRSNKTHRFVMNALRAILPDKTIPKGSFCDTTDVNRVLEVFLVLQTKPPICCKVATIVQVGRIPK